MGYVCPSTIVPTGATASTPTSRTCALGKRGPAPPPPADAGWLAGFKGGWGTIIFTGIGVLVVMCILLGCCWYQCCKGQCFELPPDDEDGEVSEMSEEEFDRGG